MRSWITAAVTVWGGAFTVFADAAINVQTDLVRHGIAPKNAAGDGVQDDAPALQAAAEYMSTRGGTIIFPRGRYLLNSEVSFRQEPGQHLEVRGEHAVILGTAPLLVGVTSRGLLEKNLTQPAGAFDTVLHVPDVEGLAVGDLVAVHSRRSSEWPTEQADNSGGVEHLAHIAKIDAVALTVTLSVPLPWHQKASNNLFKQLRKHGYYRFHMSGVDFEIGGDPQLSKGLGQVAMQFVGMKDVTLKDLTCTYTEKPRGAMIDHGGWGFRFHMVHGLYAENVDFKQVLYCLVQLGGCSDHTYVGCDGFRTRHTFVLSDSQNTIIRDSHGYDCISHLDTHRGVNGLTISGCRSVGDEHGFRNIAATCVIRDSSFSGYRRDGVRIGSGGARAQEETYALGITGEGLDQLAIDDVLTLNDGMTAAVVSIVERTATSATIFVYQLLGKDKADTALGSIFSGRGGWPMKVTRKPEIAGNVTFVEYVQAHYGRSTIQNCTFDGSQSIGSAVVLSSSFSGELRHVTIVRPFIGITAQRDSRYYRDACRLDDVRVIEPREAAFQLGNFTGIELVDCEVIGMGQKAAGITPQNGMGQSVRMTNCRFRGLKTAIDMMGFMDATGVQIEDCEIGLVLNGGRAKARLQNFRNAAVTPVIRQGFNDPRKLSVIPVLESDEPVAGSPPHTAFMHRETRRLWFQASDGWRDESGKAIAAP
jgi:hypothetical protein